MQRTRLQVPPVRTSAGRAELHVPVGEQSRKQLGEQIVFKGTATRASATWTATLYCIHLLAGFIPIPKAIRGIYPAPTPGEENTAVLKGLWYEDATDLWIWLDRTHHRLYGPDLLDKIGWLPAGTRLQIDWNAEQIVLREAGQDLDVQRAETRLVDLEELKKLRGGIGESYRQAIQTILTATPDGLTFKELASALNQRQNHEVARGTIHSILSSGGFIQHERRWFAAIDTTRGAKQLREALLETLVPQGEESRGEQQHLSHHEYVRTRAQAIHHRLQEIASMLRENVKE